MDNKVPARNPKTTTKQPAGNEQWEKFINGENKTRKGKQTVRESQFIHTLKLGVTGRNINLDQTQEVGGVKIEKGAKEIKEVITGYNHNKGEKDQKVGDIEIGKNANGIKKFIERKNGNFELAVPGESNKSSKSEMVDINDTVKGADGIEEVVTGNENKEAVTRRKKDDLRIVPAKSGKGVKVITGYKECTGKTQTIGGIKIGEGKDGQQIIGGNTAAKDVDGVATKVPSLKNSKQNIGGYTVLWSFHSF